MGLRKRFGVKWRGDGSFDEAVFEFKDEQSFREALLLFDWATSFFTTDSFFTSEDEPGPKHMKKSVSKRRLQEPEAFLDTDSGVLLRLPKERNS